MRIRLGNQAQTAAALLLTAGVWAARPAAGETLTYVLAPRPQDGQLDVELVWQTEGRASSRLCVSPRWGTVSDVPSLLKDLSFEGASAVQRERACWQLSHRPSAELRCRYRVDPGRREFDWNSTHHPITTERFFHGMGNAFLLTPAGGGDTPEQFEVLLRWKLPRGWTAVCSWGSGRTVGARLKAEDVRQSVYLAGRLVTCQGPGPVELTVGMVNAFDFRAERFAEMAASIIAGQCEFMQEDRFPPFVVTAIPVGPPLKAGDLRMAGMGLYRSFALCISPGADLTDGVEHLFAHELFHYWNGRLLAAEDPEELVYWFIEGFTDYYALRILHESGRWSPEVYAGWINRHLREYYANPARNARNEDIRARFWAERETVGEVAYQRGLLLGLRWHRLARDRGVKEGIDRLLRGLVDQARAADFLLSNSALRATGAKLLGDWFTAEFDRYVEDAETVEVPADALAPELVGRVQAVYEYQLGFDREQSLSAKRVRGLVPGSPAAEAGLRDGDELAGWTIHGDPDKKVHLQVQRGGTLKTISYYPRGQRRDLLQFEPAKAKPDAHRDS